MKRQTELLTLKILQFKHSHENTALLDHAVDSLQSPDIKNVCAKLHISLVDRLERSLSILEMSKRQFIETALISALDEFEDLFDTYIEDDFDPSKGLEK